MKGKGKVVAFGALAVVLGVIGCLAGLEIALRFLPVSSGLRSAAVTAENPIYHFQPNRTVTFSRGWDFAMLNVRRINNAGWVNDQDYGKDSALPLLAVVGDSYIEAAMVPYRETVYGRLADALQGRMRVYSFGASGAPLSQYLIWARHAVREYDAKAVVINVVGNDFDESHVAYLNGRGWWVYRPEPGGELRLHLVDYRPDWLRSLASESALMRYVFFNLQLANTWHEIMAALSGSRGATDTDYAGNTSVAADATRMNISLAVIDAFFRDLPDTVGLTPDRISFTVDGFRYPEKMADGGNSYFGKMRQAFIAKARSLHYGVIDLDQWFFADYAERRERFEFPADGHWNAVGHEVAARALLSSTLLNPQREH
jgi:hypothetical protein